MRRSRRGGHSGTEFGGSGEDSFVAVVVTKLTGALLFILLLAMVIMALIPKGDPGREAAGPATASPNPLRIATPAALPDSIAGRPYIIALAATGGRGPIRWHLDGQLPEGLILEESSGRILGTPSRPTDKPASFQVVADDGHDEAGQPLELAVLPPIEMSPVGAWWKPRWPVVASAWRSWMEQGVGFLVLWLVHLVGMNLLANLQRHSVDELAVAGDATASLPSLRRRFAAYRLLVRLATISATVGLATWIAVSHRAPM